MGWREIMQLTTDTPELDSGITHPRLSVSAMEMQSQDYLVESCDTELITELKEELSKFPDEPMLLSSWLELLRTNRMIESGIVPPSFIFSAKCKRCGDILLDYRANCSLEACCWCFSSRRPNFKRLSTYFDKS